MQEVKVCDEVKLHTTELSLLKSGLMFLYSGLYCFAQTHYVISFVFI